MTAAAYRALADTSAIALRAAACQPFAPKPELELAAGLVGDLAFAGEPAPRPHAAPERFLARRPLRHPHAAALLDTLVDAAPHLAWIGGDNGYGGEPGMAAFCAGYAFAPISGPARWTTGCAAVSDKVGVSYTVQGSGLTYPDHAHKAVEIYYVISGKALWKRGGEPWVERHPGEVILHTAGMRHAMMTGEEPLVAMAVWISDIESDVVVVRA